MVMPLTKTENLEGSTSSGKSVCSVGKRIWRKGCERNLALFQYQMFVHRPCEDEHTAGKYRHLEFGVEDRAGDVDWRAFRVL